MKPTPAAFAGVFRFGLVALGWAFVHLCAAGEVSSRPPAAEGCLYPMDFAPHAESAADIRAREQRLEEAWRDYFGHLDAMLRNPNPKELNGFIKSTRVETLLTLADDYGYRQLREPAIARLKADFARNIPLAEKTLAKQGITDIGDVANLNTAMNAAVSLKQAGEFTPQMSAQLEPLLSKYVEGKSMFWGFTRKFPYFLSGYNKEAITMNVGSNVKLLYAGTGKFPKTIDAFDAAWAQLTQNAYETDNSPHYDSSVNLLLIINWAINHHRLGDIQRAPHFRMIYERLARTVMANGQSANYGKSMAGIKKLKENGVNVDDYWVNAGGIGWHLRWAYKFWGDPNFLYLARKYDLANSSSKAPVTVMPKALDLNFFDVKGAAYRADAPVSFTTIRLKGTGGSLDRGVRREEVQPVQDKLMLSTGTHPRSPFMLMDMSFTQSKVKDKRRMSMDNLIFNAAHSITIVGRPDEAEEANRIIIAPEGIAYPGIGKPVKAPVAESGDAESDNADEKESLDAEKQAYKLRDYFVTRVNADLAYGDIEYDQLQFAGVHAKRKMALLNNGVMVVEDSVWTDAAYAGGKNAGTLYNVWSQVVDRGTNWVLLNPKKGHLPDGTDAGLTSVLVYLAPDKQLKPGLNSDLRFFAYAPLGKGQRVTIVSAVIPMPFARAVSGGRALGEGIQSGTDAVGNTVVRIPYGPGQTLKVSFNAEGPVPADFVIEGSGGIMERPAAVPILNATVNAPYSVAFGRTNEFYVPGFKADFELNENRFRSVWCGGRELTRGTDYETRGNVLMLTPAFAQSLIQARAKTDLTVKFSAGADVTLKLNADTAPGLTLFNARRSKTYTGDEMALPFGFRENSRVKAVGGDYQVTFYDDWLYRGHPTTILVKNGQTVKLPSTRYLSFRVKKLN